MFNLEAFHPSIVHQGDAPLRTYSQEEMLAYARVRGCPLSAWTFRDWIKIGLLGAAKAHAWPGRGQVVAPAVCALSAPRGPKAGVSVRVQRSLLQPPRLEMALLGRSVRCWPRAGQTRSPDVAALVSDEFAEKALRPKACPGT